MCPELPEIIETAKGASWSDDVYMFGGKNYQPIGRAFHKALDNKGRGFHDIRKWKINKWVREGVPEAVLEAVGGHEKEVRKKHYQWPFSVADLARFMQGYDSKNVHSEL